MNWGKVSACFLNVYGFFQTESRILLNEFTKEQRSLYKFRMLFFLESEMEVRRWFTIKYFCSLR